MSHLGLSTQQPLFLSTLMCTMGAGDPNSGPCAYTGTEPPLQTLKGFFKKTYCWERKRSQTVRSGLPTNSPQTRCSSWLHFLCCPWVGWGVWLLCTKRGSPMKLEYPSLRNRGEQASSVAGCNPACISLLSMLSPHACPRPVSQEAAVLP